MFLLCVFLMPETLFDRPVDEDHIAAEDIEEEGEKPNETMTPAIASEYYVPPPMSLHTYLNRLWLWDLERPASRRLRAVDFVIRPLRMLKYPSVLFPALY